MKILGISLGTKNGNNDTMCRVALEECQKLGAEIEFIHAFDWDFQTCTGCVACSRGLVMGKGFICTRKDDYRALYEKMIIPAIPLGCCGCIYTQLSDIEDEINGLYTYDRSRCKVDKERLRKIADRIFEL